MCTASVAKWAQAAALVEQSTRHAVEVNGRTGSSAIVKRNALMTSFGFARHWAFALMELHNLRRVLKPDVISCSAAITACERGNRWTVALGLLSAMSAFNVEVDVIALGALLSALRWGGSSIWQCAFLIMIGVSRAGSLQPNVVVHNSALYTCKGGCTWQKQSDLLAEWRQLGVRLSVTTYNVMMSGCCSATQRYGWSRALEAFRHLLRQSGVSPDVVSMNVVVAACTSTWRWALQLLSHVPVLSLRVDVVSMCSVLSAFVVKGPWISALRVAIRSLRALLRVPIQGSSEENGGGGHISTDLAPREDRPLQKVVRQSSAPSLNDVDVATCLGASVRATSCSDPRQWTACLELYSRALILGLRATGRTSAAMVAVCNDLVDALGHGGRWESALRWTGELRHFTLQPTTITFNSLLSVCGLARRWTLCFEVVCTLTSSSGLEADCATLGGVVQACATESLWTSAIYLLTKHQRADLISCNVCISVCAKAALWRSAEHLLQWALHASLVPDLVSFNTALCQQPLGWRRTLMVWHEKRDRNKRTSAFPDVVTYNVAGSICGDANEWQWTAHLVEHMRVERIVATDTTCGMALEVCGKSLQWTRSMLLLFRALSQTLEPTDMATGILMKAFEASLSWEQSTALLHAMETAGTKPHLTHFNTALSVCEKTFTWMCAVHLATEGKASGVSCDILTCNSLISACEKVSHWERALGWLNIAQTTRLAPSQITYNALLAACEKSLLPSAWYRNLLMFDDMQRLQLAPDDVSYQCAIRACGLSPTGWAIALTLLRDSALRRTSPAWLELWSAASWAREAGIALLEKHDFQNYGRMSSMSLF